MTGWIEVVHTLGAQPWHCRVKGGNGETVWWTEPYADSSTAVEAILLLPGLDAAVKTLDDAGNLQLLETKSAPAIEVRWVDERPVGQQTTEPAPARGKPAKS